VIEITGALPEMLIGYDAEALGDWIIWDTSYQIPRAAAQELVLLIRGQDGVDISFYNEDGEYAVVLYSPIG